jgi:hypothetical protein
MNDVQLQDGEKKIAPFTTHTLKPGVGDRRVVRLYYFSSVPANVLEGKPQITIVIQESPDASLPNPTLQNVEHVLTPVLVSEDLLENNIYMFQARFVGGDAVVYAAQSLVPVVIEEGVFADARAKPAYASKNMELIAFMDGDQPLYTSEELEGDGFARACAEARGIVVVSRREVIEQ